MRFHRFVTVTSLSLLLAGPFVTTTQATQAATFSTQEINQVQQFQNQYASLDQTPYSSATLYQKTPHLSAPFDAGVLAPAYRNTQLAAINYYRSLFGLSAITSNATDNENAQVTASVMAAINANPFQNQHGLPSESKPSFMADAVWNIAKSVSASSNLNFNMSNESAGDVIKDLITDSYNLSGMDTGHRAWLLSTRLATTGIGAAYGSNGYRYSVQQVVYALDQFRSPQKQEVAYPSSGVFPIELLQGTNIAWSLYLSNQTISGIPDITVTDLDTGQKSSATHVNNYSNANYGNFKTILTYYPGAINLVSGHQYRVSVNGVTSYTFKLFNQIAANQPTLTTQDNSTSNQQNQSNNQTDVTTKQPAQSANTPEVADVHIESVMLRKAKRLQRSLLKWRLQNSRVFGRSYQDGNSYYNLGRYQWFRDFYHVDNPKIKAGVLTVSDHWVDRHIYTSPYRHLQEVKMTSLIPNQQYAFGQTIKVGRQTWYYLGPHSWVKK